MNRVGRGSHSFFNDINFILLLVLSPYALLTVGMFAVPVVMLAIVLIARGGIEGALTPQYIQVCLPVAPFYLLALVWVVGQAAKQAGEGYARAVQATAQAKALGQSQAMPSAVTLNNYPALPPPAETAEAAWVAVDATKADYEIVHY